MLLIKTRSDTLRQVIDNCKHATDSIPGEIKHGDIILISQTKKTLRKNQKSIGCLMHFDKIYEDLKNESDALWGQHWRYIIKGYDIQNIKNPFNIEDIQASKKNYGPIVTHCSLLKEDEDAVQKYLLEKISSN